MSVRKNTSDKVSQYFSNKPLLHFKKGEFVMKAGIKPQYIYYIVSGHVREFDTNAQGNEMVLNVYKPGAFFSMSHAFNDKLNEYYYQAFTKTNVRVAKINEAYEFVTSNSDVMEDLLKRVFIGTDGLLKRISLLMSGSAKSKLINEMLIHTLRFGHIYQNNSAKIRITLTELATRAGLSRETASRVVSDLKSNGQVSTPDPKIIIIEDINSLKEEMLIS